MLLNNQWITEEIKKEIKKYLEANDNIGQSKLNDAFSSCRYLTLSEGVSKTKLLLALKLNSSLIGCTKYARLKGLFN